MWYIVWIWPFLSFEYSLHLIRLWCGSQPRNCLPWKALLCAGAQAVCCRAASTIYQKAFRLPACPCPHRLQVLWDQEPCLSYPPFFTLPKPNSSICLTFYIRSVNLVLLYLHNWSRIQALLTVFTAAPCSKPQPSPNSLLNLNFCGLFSTQQPEWAC